MERCHLPRRQRHEEEKEAPETKLGDVLGDEESRALVADLMLEGCSDVLLTEERELQNTKDLPRKPDPDPATRARDDEVEIIDEKRHPVLLSASPAVRPAAAAALLQPLVLPTLTALQPVQPTVVMSLVAGANGQVFLLPTATAAQTAQPPPAPAQPQTILLSSWPTPPSSVSPATSSVLSPASVLSTAEGLEIQVRAVIMK